MCWAPFVRNVSAATCPLPCMTIVAIDARFRNSHCGCRASERRLVDPTIKWWSMSALGHKPKTAGLTNVCPPIADMGVSQVTLV